MYIQLSFLVNLFIYFWIILFSVVIQTTLFNTYLFGRNIAPELLVILTIYFGLRRTFNEGLFSTFVIGYVFSIHSSSGSSIPLIFLITFIATQYSCAVFYIKNTKQVAIMIFGISYLFKILECIWLWWGDSNLSIGPVLGYGLINSFFNLILGLLLFKFFSWIDFKTGRYSPDAVT